MTALLPCPWCGGPASAEKVSDPWKPEHWIAGCNECNGERGGSVFFEGDSREDVVTAWNTRPSPARDEGAGTMGRGAVAWIVAWHHKPSDGVKDPGGRSEVIRNNYAAVEARVSNLKALGWVDSITVTPLYAAPVSAPRMGWIDGRRFSEQAGERWRHVKSGGVYSLPFGRAEAMVQCAEPITDESTLTVYIGEDGMIFARPTHEFHDGRFVRLPAESGVDADEGRAGNLPPEEPIPSNPPFIQWNGGENPAGTQMIEWRNRSGHTSSCRADQLMGWEHPHELSEDFDIIAYRIIPTDDQGGEGT